MTPPAIATDVAAAPPLPVLPPTDAAWTLVEEGFAVPHEHEIESLFAVTNGYLGSRAAMPEGAPLSSPGTFIAGVFERLAGSFPELMVAPEWTVFSVWVEGHKLASLPENVLAHRRVLDLRQGLLWRELRYRDPDGRITRAVGFRFASLADRHLLVQVAALLPENYSGRLHMESRIEAPVTARGTGITVAFAAHSSSAPHMAADGNRQVEANGTQVIERFESRAEIGVWNRADRMVAVYTSREAERPAEAAGAGLRRALSNGMEAALDAHVRAWQERWEKSDIEIEGDPAAQRTLRFAAYHLIGAANPDDERVSIGARALTGMAYKGHVFWDTEIYMLPFYIFTHPASARALLMYRYHTLPAAREKARAFGLRGAMYPWESADTGEEVTPLMVIDPAGEVIPVRNGTQEQHITADVAYGVWQYWQATRDEKFFAEAGAEIMLATASFWASRGRWEDDGKVHIRGVIGPDEYHENVDDNVYTNLMARWNLERGVETANLLRQSWPEQWKSIAGRLTLTDDEVAEWERVACAMYAAPDPGTHVYEQFRGYYGLEPVDLARYEPRTAAMDVLLGHERIQHTNVVKQADTVMALYLLWDRFTAEEREANFRYYELRTGHGSSLSPSIHALVAARLGNLALADRYFRQAAEIDLANNMGNASGGIHAAAMGGLWQAVVFGFAGLHTSDDGLTLDPHLPPRWRSLRFPLQWRGRQLRIEIQRDPLRTKVEEVQS